MNTPAHTSAWESAHRIPDNEFTEFCTGDMHDMDTTYHHWLQDRWTKEREAYNAKHGILTKGNGQ